MLTDPGQQPVLDPVFVGLEILPGRWRHAQGGSQGLDKIQLRDITGIQDEKGSDVRIIVQLAQEGPGRLWSYRYLPVRKPHSALDAGERRFPIHASSGSCPENGTRGPDQGNWKTVPDAGRSGCSKTLGIINQLISLCLLKQFLVLLASFRIAQTAAASQVLQSLFLVSQGLQG